MRVAYLKYSLKCLHKGEEIHAHSLSVRVRLASTTPSVVVTIIFPKRCFHLRQNHIPNQNQPHRNSTMHYLQKVWIFSGVHMSLGNSIYFITRLHHTWVAIRDETKVMCGLARKVIFLVFSPSPLLISLSLSLSLRRPIHNSLYCRRCCKS